MGCMAEPKICVIHSVSSGTPFSCLQRARPFDENRWPGFAPAGDLLSCLCKKARQRSTARFRAPSGFPPCGVVGLGASQTRPAGSNSEAPFSARHRLRLARQRAGRLCLAERLRWFRRVVSFAAHQATCARRHNGGRQPAHPTKLCLHTFVGCFVGRKSEAPSLNAAPAEHERRMRLRLIRPTRMPTAVADWHAFPLCRAERSKCGAEEAASLFEPTGRVREAARPGLAEGGKPEGPRRRGVLLCLPFLHKQESKSPAGAKPGQRTSDTRTPRHQGDKP